MRVWLARLLLRAATRLLYTPHERVMLFAAVEMVAGNERIPAFPIQAKRGREYRRDEAAFQAHSATGMRQSRVNLGVEIACYLSRPHKPDIPRKHHHSVPLE